MKIHKIRFQNLSNNYSILIGKNLISILPSRIRKLCPKTKKIAVIIDKKIPIKFKTKIRKILRNYKVTILPFEANEKNKSLDTVNYYLKKLLLYNLNRSDLIIAVGGGITGDVVGFIASIFKRGINFINVPTTLLAQVDSAVGGKTGVNSVYGKNLIGSFYQPKIVINDISFLDTLPKKEIICGYAEILKHAIINDRKFFIWLKKSSGKILSRKMKELIYAIKKSCEIKMYFVNKDVSENNLRMSLNFGHTFAHAIEVKNNYSKKITHGEAVLSGMILASRLSFLKKICNYNTLKEIENIYKKNNLTYTYKNFSSSKSIINLIPFLKNDKKNDDEKINFILLKKIGKITNPNSCKMSVKELKKYFRKLVNANF